MLTKFYRSFTALPLLKPLFGRAWQVKMAVRRAWKARFPEPAIREFMAHNRRKYPVRENAPAVVLVGQFHWNPNIYLYSLVANEVCARTGARIDSFDFNDQRDLLAESLAAG